jgi:hypothetical protein
MSQPQAAVAAKPLDITAYVNQARNDAVHSRKFLKDSGSLSATDTYNLDHRIPGTEDVIAIRFTSPWDKNPGEPIVAIKPLSDYQDTVFFEPRFEVDTIIHAHTPHLAAWSLAHLDFPIRYVAAQRHLVSRTIPNHLDRTRTPRDVLTERLNKHPELAPPPGLLESNGGSNYWGKGIIWTSTLILLLEEAARYQAIAAPLGGAKDYNPGTLEQQWKRTGLLEKAKAYKG